MPKMAYYRSAGRLSKIATNNEKRVAFSPFDSKGDYVESLIYALLPVNYTGNVKLCIYIEPLEIQATEMEPLTPTKE